MRGPLDGDMCVYLTEEEADALEDLLGIAQGESLVRPEMLSAVNQVRAARGLPPISVSPIDMPG